MSRSTSSLPPSRPSEQDDDCRGLYEVATGVIMLRSAPDVHSPGVGALSGGMRFYAVPRRVGCLTWLKVETDSVTPPMFSPSALGRPQEELQGHSFDHAGKLTFRPKPGKVYRQNAIAKGLSLYLESSPKTLYGSSANLQAVGGLWVHFEAQSVVRMRDAPDFRASVLGGFSTQQDTPSASPSPAADKAARRLQAVKNAVPGSWPGPEPAMSSAARRRLESMPASVSVSALQPRTPSPRDISSPVSQGLQTIRPCSVESAGAVALAASVSAEETAAAAAAEVLDSVAPLPPPESQVDLRYTIAQLEDRLEAKQREIDELRGRSAETIGVREGDPVLKGWASYGNGGWTNFRKFGALHSPPNNNCGRWRQLGPGPGTFT